MDKRIRDLRRSVNTLCEKTGCRSVAWEMTGGTHQRVRIERADGVPVAYVFAFSPSDKRSILNSLAGLRRALTQGDTK